MKYLLGYTAFLSLIFVTVGYTVADLTDDLVFYFTFDNVEGKRILDESENGLDAEVSEGTIRSHLRNARLQLQEYLTSYLMN